MTPLHFKGLYVHMFEHYFMKYLTPRWGTFYCIALCNVGLHQSISQQHNINVH